MLQICKYFLCGFCPAALLANTKSALPECPKVHDEKIKTLSVWRWALKKKLGLNN